MTEAGNDAVGGRTRRPRNPRGQGARLREEIVAATVELIDRLGNVEAVSLRAVARQAGIDPMSIYRHFADKDELVWAVLDTEFAQLAHAMEEAADGHQTPGDRLRARCLSYVRFGLERRGEFLVLFGTEGRPPPPQGRPEQLPGWPVFAALADDVAACLAARGTAPAVDATTQATLLWAALHGLTVLRLSKQGFPWPPVELLVDHLLGELVDVR
jgi:AcrR family transcriptional regulator